MTGHYLRGRRGKYKKKFISAMRRKIMDDMEKVSINKTLVKQLEGVTFIEYENVKKPINTNI